MTRQTSKTLFLSLVEINSMRIIYFLVFISLMTCKQPTPIISALSIIDKIPNHQGIKDSLKKYEVQIKLSDAKKDYSYNVNDQQYFYPASTVKFPIALLALEKVNQIPQLNSQSPFEVAGDSIQTTIRKEVQKIFAISDNEAYNRLFEFLGTDYINEQLHNKGLKTIQISHRLAIDDAANPNTKEILFFNKDSIIYHRKPIKNTILDPLTLNKIYKGKGFYKNDSLVNSPMDFSRKNYASITALHGLMQRIHFPEKFTKSELFDLSEDDRNFLLNTMHQTPKKQGYDESEYYDGYVKFFLFGDTKEKIPDHIKIYNKVGYAYGYLTDCAYIVDEKNGISFLLTATIHVNKNRIFNDNTYEYDTIGIPFLANLGREIHKFYLNN